MRPHEATGEIITETFGDVVNRDAGGVGADDGVRLGDFGDLRHQILFDVETFDDDFDNPVGIGDFVEVVFDVADADVFQREFPRFEQFLRGLQF